MYGQVASGCFMKLQSVSAKRDRLSHPN